MLISKDSAYSEFVTKKTILILFLTQKRKDIIVTHTFSKIFGLSSLRLGWAYCPKRHNDSRKIRPAFNLNSYVNIGNNILDDKSLEKSIEHNYYWKNWLSNEFKN